MAGKSVIAAGGLSARADNGRHRLASSISSPDGDLPKELWFDVPEGYADSLSSDRLDSVALALLVPAMERGCDLHLDGPVCPFLLDNINERVIPLLAHFLEVPKRRATASCCAPRIDGERAIGSGFSGGVDSFHTIQKYGTRERLRPNLFFFFDVGQFGTQTDWRDVSLSVVRRGLPEAETLIDLRSNMNDFYRSDFMKTHSIRNVAAALLFQKTIDRFYVASGFALDRFELGGKDMAYLDPILLPVFATDSFRIIQTGFDESRIEKLASLAEFPPSYDNLFVCIDDRWKGPPNNCSRCSKCRRTMVLLDALGAADRYAAVFDLASYRVKRWRYQMSFYATADDFIRQLEQVSKEHDYSVPSSARHAGTLCRWLMQVSPAWLQWRIRAWLERL